MKNKIPSDIDEYIAQFPEDTRRKLSELRELIRKLAPDAIEKISYGIPTYYLKGNLVHFAGYEKHIGFYPSSSGIDEFKDRLSGYKTSKGTVQFPIDDEIPCELVEDMVRFRIKENLGAK
jgi:uncharacterized protein YdhG (YjbR/CyaY superfamily)